MKLLFDVYAAQTKLDLYATNLDDAAKLKATMLEVSADLKAAVERDSANWGRLTGLVKALESGKPWVDQTGG